MENPIQPAIQKMGGDFLVAAFIPAMAFIVICSITFESILSRQFIYQGDTPGQVFQSTLNLLLFTTILGFTLHTLSTYIYKTFEGYTPVLNKDNPIRRSFMRRQKKRFINIEKRLARVDKQLENIQKKLDSETEKPKSGSWRAKRFERQIKDEQTLKNVRYDLIATRELFFPPSVDSIMPTRFGNIIKAAETYPVFRYRIDSVLLWSRLSHVIPNAGMNKIDQASNQSLFLLNSVLLASIYGILCVSASIYQTTLIWVLNDNTSPQMILLYLVLAILGGITAWIFYEASLFNVGQFGDMIRTAYDLYRFNLLEALHLPLPKSLEDEKQTWRGLSEFMVGNEAFGPINFIYQHPPKQPAQNTPESTEDEE